MDENEKVNLTDLYFESFLRQAMEYEMNREQIEKYITDNFDKSYKKVLKRTIDKHKMYLRLGIS